MAVARGKPARARLAARTGSTTPMPEGVSDTDEAVPAAAQMMRSVSGTCPPAAWMASARVRASSAQFMAPADTAGAGPSAVVLPPGVGGAGHGADPRDAAGDGVRRKGDGGGGAPADRHACGPKRSTLQAGEGRHRSRSRHQRADEPDRVGVTD